MTNRHLITWLLNLDILEADEFGRAYLHGQLALNFIVFAFARALQERHKDLLWDNLVNFEATHIAHIDSDLHLWFDITSTHDDTFNVEKGANQISFSFPHFDNLLLSILTVHNKDLVSSLEFLWDTRVWWSLINLDALALQMQFVVKNVRFPLFH